jgi:hypothetical protein
MRTALQSADYYDERVNEFRALLNDMATESARDALKAVIREYERMATKARKASQAELPRDEPE